jgi:SOS-response transcriptional repressor LexA
MDSPKDRLKRARVNAGFETATDAAAKLRQINKNTLLSNENGNRAISRKMAQTYADAFNTTAGWILYGEDSATITPVKQIRVEGVSQAGMFRDISLIEDDEHERKTIPAPINPKYAHVHQYALLVAGDSMNNKFQDGSYVTCADWAGLGKELKHGMILHVERVKAGSMIETTIKTYIERDGKRWLEPDSTNSKHLPIEVNGSLDTEIHIKGAVIGSYTEFDI